MITQSAPTATATATATATERSPRTVLAGSVGERRT